MPSMWRPKALPFIPETNSHTHVRHEFSTIGNLDTIIYQLRHLKSLDVSHWNRHNGCHIYVQPLGGETQHSLEYRFDDMLSLVRAQPYVQEVSYDHPFGECVNLDAVELPDSNGPWLSVDMVKPSNKVIISWKNTPQANPPKKEWQELCEKHGSDCLFMGGKNELQLFRAKTGVGDMEHMFKKNSPSVQRIVYLNLARMIAGCQLFAGNQSILTSIAEGLGVKMLKEIDGKLVPMNTVSPSVLATYASPAT